LTLLKKIHIIRMHVLEHALYDKRHRQLTAVEEAKALYREYVNRGLQGCNQPMKKHQGRTGE
jgi:hypothetical protein